MSHNNLNSEKALNEIRILIKENKLLKGNKLPNERLLSSVINCNRSYIRNALLILEREGLVSRKIGSGTFVNQSSIQSIEFKDVGIEKKDIQNSSFLKSIETRLSIEPYVFSSVAKVIKYQEKKKLRNKLDNIKKSKIWLDFKVRTYEFFYYIYQLSMNKYYINLFNEIVEDRKKLNFDRKLIKTKISRIVVMNSYLNLYKIYKSINENKSEETFDLSKEYLTNILISLHL